jgi:hypothetical protein
MDDNAACETVRVEAHLVKPSTLRKNKEIGHRPKTAPISNERH